MLQFLKDSTFKANDVIMRALVILKGHYFSIAGLCFMLFAVSQTITFLSAYYQSSLHFFVQLLLIIVSIIVFFGLQLILIKRAILLSKGVEHTDLKNYIPTTKQFVNFLLGLVMLSILTGVVTLISGVLCFPLLYIGFNTDFVIYEAVPALAGIIVTVLVLRITFFPFFILEKGLNIFRAIKLSIAFTKGNFLKLVTIFFFLLFTSLLTLLSSYLGYSWLMHFFTAVTIFVVIPLVSLAMAVAYVDMMEEYKGGDDPSLLANII